MPEEIIAAYLRYTKKHEPAKLTFGGRAQITSKSQGLLS
jgi:hypothetical protein